MFSETNQGSFVSLTVIACLSLLQVFHVSCYCGRRIDQFAINSVWFNYNLSWFTYRHARADRTLRADPLRQDVTCTTLRRYFWYRSCHTHYDDFTTFLLTLRFIIKTFNVQAASINGSIGLNFRILWIHLAFSKLKWGSRWVFSYGSHVFLMT